MSLKSRASAVIASDRYQISRVAPSPSPLAKPKAARMYESARVSRLTSDWPVLTGSADNELHTSLTRLVARSRQLCRDNPYARRARQIIAGNVIGSGIGMQAGVRRARGALDEAINGAIEAAWADWTRAEACHRSQALHFSDLERLLLEEVFEAGEVLVRFHPEGAGRYDVPMQLEVIEAERLAHDYATPSTDSGNVVKMGIELDSRGRVVAYYVYQLHPNEYRMQPGMSQKLDRIPANQICHLRLTHRWPQTRGEPWMHAVIRRLHDMQAYSDAEITAARAAACYMGFIKSPDPQFAPNAADPEMPPEVAMEPGMVERLGAGEDFISYTPTRPNTAMDAFLRLLVREVGSGADVPYEPLSGDYSQSNYSSSRLALIENREHWRHLQRWYIRSFREPLHRLWLQSAVYAGVIPAIDQTAYAINPRRFEAVTFKPRGWSWVDPTKEVQAYADAVANGFMTVSEVIALTGGGKDIEDVLNERRRELDLAASKGLSLEIPRPGAAPTPEPVNAE